MNPLFVSHLVADFLLQPKWLVAWKQKNICGVVLHGILHSLTITLFIWPQNWLAYFIIAFIAASHIAIDQLKIRYQKRHNAFALSFIADQLLHLAVLVFAALILQLKFPSYWLTEAGKGTFFLLFTFSFALAIFNLSQIDKFPLHNKKEMFLRAMLIVISFGIYLMPAKLLALQA